MVLFVLTGIHFESFPVSQMERPLLKQASDGTTEKSKNRSLPIYFIENKGILDSRVEYFASGTGYAFYLSRDGATYALQNQVKLSSDSGQGGIPHRYPRGHALKVKFAGAASTGISGRGPQAAKFNYFVGKDKQKWRSGVRSYSQVALDDLHDGIDLVFKSDRRRIKYEFTVAPGADFRNIRLDYEGAESLALDDKGTLLTNTPVGQVKDARPFIFQNINGRRVRIEGGFAVNGRSVGFWVGDQNKDRPLIIDPGLSYSTFIGGGNLDYGVDLLSLDASGCAYVTGYTYSLNFPTTAGVYDNTYNGQGDIFATKLEPNGAALSYSTFLGGSNADYGSALFLDAANNAYLTGRTSSADFPATANAFDQSKNAGYDGIAAKIDALGSTLVYSSFLGGAGDDFANDISLALDPACNIYLAGSSNSTDFPISPAAFDPANSGLDAFVAKMGLIAPTTTLETSPAALDGDRRLYYHSADDAENTETVRLQPLPVDTNDPTPPVLTALSTTMTAITLSWSEATDAASGIDRYRIQRATGGLVLGETSSTMFMDTGLTPDSSCSYYVKAGDRSGRWSAPSNITTATTDSTPSPPAPNTGVNLTSLAVIARLATALGAAMLSSGRKRTADTTRKGC